MSYIQQRQHAYILYVWCIASIHCDWMRSGFSGLIYSVGRDHLCIVPFTLLLLQQVHAHFVTAKEDRIYTSRYTYYKMVDTIYYRPEFFNKIGYFRIWQNIIFFLLQEVISMGEDAVCGGGNTSNHQFSIPSLYTHQLAFVVLLLSNWIG